MATTKMFSDCCTQEEVRAKYRKLAIQYQSALEKCDDQTSKRELMEKIRELLEKLEWQTLVQHQNYLLRFLLDRISEEEKENSIRGLERYLSKYSGADEEYALFWLKKNIT